MTPPDMTESRSGRLSGSRVLVIDDNVSIHEDVKKILGGASPAQISLRGMESVLFGTARTATPSAYFEIDCASQGEEGLARLRQARAELRPYALAFVDGRMPPGWDGIETIAHLWREQPDLQVVLCTAYSDYTWHEIRQVLGESDNLLILKKPFDNVEVLQLAHALTKKWHLGRLVLERIEGLDRLVSERDAEVRRTMALFEASIAQSPVGILIAEAPEVTLRWVNVAARALLSQPEPTPADATPPSVSRWQLFHLDGSPCSGDVHPLARAVRGGVTTRDLELLLHHSSGKERHLQVSAAPIRDPGGQVIAAIAILQDITAQRASELERETLRERIAEAQKLECVGRLAGGVAHDFNNMLQAILGNIEIINLMLGSANPVKEELLQIHQAAERSAQLTRQLLAFARRQAIQPVLLDLNDAISSTLRMLQRLIGENIHLVWAPASNLWPVRIDPSQVDQLLAHLMVNARDAIAGAGTVTLRTSNVTIDADAAQRHADATAGDYVVLSVSDSGCGMDGETQRHVFEPFFTTKDIGKGSGLGLATVFGIVRQNGGFIELQTKPGAGTTFHIHVPRTSVSGGAPDASAASAIAGGDETLLLVEDELQVLRLGARALSQHGYKVLTAATPEAALALAEQAAHGIDLLVTDVVMPRMNGKQLLERLRILRPGLRCLFVSGYTADIIAQQGVVEADACFLQKPFTIQALTASVREALQKPATPGGHAGPASGQRPA